MKIVRTRYTIAKPSCAPLLDPNTQVLFSGGLMCVRACTNFTDPLPSISPTNPFLTSTEMLGSCRSIWIPVHGAMDRYHFYDHGLIVRRRRRRNRDLSGCCLLVIYLLTYRLMMSAISIVNQHIICCFVDSNQS